MRIQDWRASIDTSSARGRSEERQSCSNRWILYSCMEVRLVQFHISFITLHLPPRLESDSVTGSSSAQNSVQSGWFLGYQYKDHCCSELRACAVTSDPMGHEHMQNKSWGTSAFLTSRCLYLCYVIQNIQTFGKAHKTKAKKKQSWEGKVVAV